MQSIKYLGLGLMLSVLAGCDMDMNGMHGSNYAGKKFSSNGERIYFTGRSQSGTAISFSGGNMHAQGHQGGCVSCHGENRQGGRRMYPMFWLKTPPLTADALFDAHDQGHGDHDAYTLDALKVAITQGKDPSGKEMDTSMPRWSMGEEDLNDLVTFLGQGSAHLPKTPHNE
ncbi:cytochrome c [Pseudomonas sp. CC6-YY-74]|uniref:c-type cytochrome n=1 Tax=Pseudomonas sp. CC6-YY-74 TaxID=1930532 RepID=UPI0009A173BF|nr:cytochrome c [Pseudomonas sp. CC6-YY-74]